MKKRGSDGTGSAAAAKRQKLAPGGAAAVVTAPAPPASAPSPLVVVPPPPRAGKAEGISANWQRLKQAIGATGSGSSARRAAAADRHDLERRPRPQNGDRSLTRVLGLDCEMVGVGPDGSKSALARVVVVNAHGNAVLDTHVLPPQRVTDYRTAVSGVRPHHLANAPSLSDVQARVAALLAGRVVVGHALRNDLKALLLSHPRRLLRDTARYPPLMRRAPHVGGPTPEARRGRPAKLQELAAQHLGLTIQTGEHSPLEDARAAVLLYHKFAADWERWLRTGGRGGSSSAGGNTGGHGRASRAVTVSDDAAGDDVAAVMGAAAAAAAEAGAGDDEPPEAPPHTSQQRWKRKREQSRAHAGLKHPPPGDRDRRRAGGGWSALLQRASSRGAE